MGERLEGFQLPALLEEGGEGFGIEQALREGCGGIARGREAAPAGASAQGLGDARGGGAFRPGAVQQVAPRLTGGARREAEPLDDGGGGSGGEGGLEGEVGQELLQLLQVLSEAAFREEYGEQGREGGLAGGRVGRNEARRPWAEVQFAEGLEDGAQEGFEGGWRGSSSR